MTELKLYLCKETFVNEKSKISKGEFYIVRGDEIFGTRYNELFDIIECFQNLGHVMDDEMKHLEQVSFNDYFEDEED